jgi:hypothetical protein
MSWKIKRLNLKVMDSTRFQCTFNIYNYRFYNKYCLSYVFSSSISSVWTYHFSFDIVKIKICQEIQEQGAVISGLWTSHWSYYSTGHIPVVYFTRKTC